MKKLGFIASLLFASLLFVNCGNNKDAQNKDGVSTIKTEKTVNQIQWVGRKLAGEHYGTIDVSNLNLKIEEGRLVEGSSFEVDMTTIVCSDIKNAEDNKDFVDHLKADDFFSTKNFPTATYVIEEITELGEGRYEGIGNLNIKGTENPVKSRIEIRKVNDSYEVFARIRFDRTKFGITYKSKSVFSDLGDKFIEDMVSVDANFKIPVK